tara:strand:+ start:153 stop:1217 length:1065 start_codon:yes stop_codon:yes gene_type:complete
MAATMKEKNIQRRNLQISGGATYVISLPKKWIEKLNLKNGDSMQIVNNSNNSITLLPDSQEEKQSSHSIIKIKKTDSLESIKRKIISLYISGYNYIVVKSPRTKIDTEVRAMIIKLVRTKFMGTEIIESDSESIKIKVLSSTPEIKLELAFNRMCKSTSNVLFEIVHAIEKNDSEYAQEIITMDDEIDCFSHYLTRNLTMSLDDSNILSALGLEHTSQVISYKRIITCIERVADHVSIIARNIISMNEKNITKTPKNILSAYEKTIKLFEEVMNFGSNKKYSEAETLAQNTEKLIDETNKLINSLNRNSDLVFYQNLLNENRRILDYTLDICEAIMNDTVKSVVSLESVEIAES